jgi:N-acylneuraminate cytidylyltransferase
MKTICIIPARGGSKGIPKKNIIDFNGQPLISYSINQALACDSISSVYVTSDCENILEVSQNYGAKTILRPSEISSDISSSEEALIHAILKVKENFDSVVFLQATSPIRTPDDIEKGLRCFHDKKLDSIFSVSKTENCFIWQEKPEGIKSINYDYKHRKMRQELTSQYTENGSIYIFEKSGFLKKQNRIFGKKSFFVLEKWKAFEIDSYEDLEVCEIMYKLKIKPHS